MQNDAQANLFGHITLKYTNSVYLSYTYYDQRVKISCQIAVQFHFQERQYQVPKIVFT